MNPPDQDAPLLAKVAELTGLPHEIVERELSDFLKNEENGTSDLTLEDLRTAMVAYLDSIQADILSESEKT